MKETSNSEYTFDNSWHSGHCCCSQPVQEASPSEDLSTKFRRAKRGARRFVVNVIAQQGIRCTSIAYKTFVCNMYENKGSGSKVQ